MLESIGANPRNHAVPDGLRAQGAMDPDERIMVVEDNTHLRQSLCEALEMSGFEVSSATNGQDALQQLRDARSLPRLILLDLMMPVMSGYQFLEEKGRDGELAGIPVLILSAFHDQAPQTRDTVGRVPKPFRLEQLIDTIETSC